MSFSLEIGAKTRIEVELRYSRWLMASLVGLLCLAYTTGCGNSASTSKQAAGDGESSNESNESQDTVVQTPKAEDVADKQSASQQNDNSKTEAQSKQNAPSSDLPTKPDSNSNGSRDDKVRDGSKVPTPNKEVSKEPMPPSNRNQPEMRLLLLFDSRLVLLDCLIRVDGKKPDESTDAIIARLLKLADENEDGNATWMELLKQKSFIYGQFGTGLLTSDEQRQSAIRNNDTNRNGFVDTEELKAMLGRTNDDRSMRPGRSSVDSGVTNLFASLDQDVNGLLSDAEIQAASRRLFIGDINDDGTLSSDELNPVASPFAAPRRRRVVQSQSNLLVVIRQETEWGTLLADLENAYSFGGPLDEDSFASNKGLFALLDENKNGQVDLKEVERLLTHAKPVGRIEVNVAMNPTVQIVLSEANSEASGGKPLGITIRKLATNRVAIHAGDQRAAIEVPASQPATGESQAASILGSFDANQDGYLVESELENAPLPVPFEGIDLDEDKKIFKPELTHYFDELLRNQSSPFSFEASSAQNSLFSIIDENGDGTLGEREILQVPKMLRRYDADGDGKIRTNEIPRTARIRFVRRQNIFIPNGIATGEEQESEDKERPDWFKKMDRNRDGEISAREFLGSQQQFDKLDKNGDRFLSYSELEKVGK